MDYYEREQELVDQFSNFDDDLDKFSYLIALGSSLSCPEEGLCSEENLVSGCESEVWLKAKSDNGVISIQAYSDTVLVRGMLAMLCTCVNGLCSSDIPWNQFSLFEKTGVDVLLSETRKNGLSAIMKKIEALTGQQ